MISDFSLSCFSSKSITLESIFWIEVFVGISWRQCPANYLGIELCFWALAEKGKTFWGWEIFFCINRLAVRGATAVSGEKGANIRQPFSANTHPPTLQFSSCSISHIWLTVFVQTSRMYFLAVFFMQYFLNVVNGICPLQLNLSLGRNFWITPLPDKT